ncbi:hypothetical protein QE152_g31134 [Popillia japonica]|uniref:Uncharacterized protein n=1 Tax=Popillia japonica TaxID=7064 RepID=A0AAW1JCF3_POPJA
MSASTYPDIHQIMRARNTNTNKAFSDIWTQMRGLYLKVIDSTENVSWETYKQYLAQNISYTPYLATEDILTWLADAPNDIQHMVPRSETHDNFGPNGNIQTNRTIFFMYFRIRFRFLLFHPGIARTMQCHVTISISRHGRTH